MKTLDTYIEETFDTVIFQKHIDKAQTRAAEIAAHLEEFSKYANAPRPDNDEVKAMVEGALEDILDDETGETQWKIIAIARCLGDEAEDTEESIRGGIRRMMKCHDMHYVEFCRSGFDEDWIKRARAVAEEAATEWEEEKNHWRILEAQLMAMECLDAAETIHGTILPDTLLPEL